MKVRALAHCTIFPLYAVSGGLEQSLCIRLLECFRIKWKLVFRKEARKIKELGSVFESLKNGKTLAPIRICW